MTGSSPEENHINSSWIYQVLEKVKNGEISVPDAVGELSILPYEELGFANIDHHRGLRLAFPEVIFGLGKTPEQIAAIAEKLLARSDRLLVTRAAPEAYTLVKQLAADAVYHPVSRAITVARSTVPLKPGIAVISAGTSDIPVAEEAAVTAGIMGNKVETYFDIGVAGLHRMLGKLPRLREARAIVVAAGMEGALASVVGGLVSVPVIAVPTSIGYGASFNGLAPLLTMLNSCAPGVSVVNIDNGFGAGYLAAMINLQHGES